MRLDIFVFVFVYGIYCIYRYINRFYLIHRWVLACIVVVFVVCHIPRVSLIVAELFVVEQQNK